MGMEKVALIVFGLIFVQGIFTFVQIRSYNKKIRELKKYGMLGIGVKKGRITPGNIILLVINENGKVIRCERMKGISVFARFREVKELSGVELGKLKETVVQNLRYNKKGIAKPDPLLQAIERLEAKLAS